jgi:peptidoglycan/LPS O-acetylase OafA/YrhL
VLATLLFGAVAAVDLGEPGIFATVAAHGVTFLLAYTVGSSGRGAGRTFLFWAVVLAGLGGLFPQFRYGAVALGALALGTAYARRCRPGQWFATYSYEWFLVHGLCLHAVIYLGVGRLDLLLPLGVAASLISAVVLKVVVESLMARVNSLAGVGRRGEDGGKLLPPRPLGVVVVSRPRLPHAASPR